MKQLYKNVLLWAVILVMFVAFYQFFNVPSQQPRDLSYGDFLTYVDQGRVKDLVIKGQKYVGHLRTSYTEFVVRGEVPSSELLDRLHNHGVDFTIQRDERDGVWWSFFLQGSILFMLLLLLVIVTRKAESKGEPVVDPAPTRLIVPRENELRLADVAGLGGTRTELETLLGQLKDESKVIRLGGEAPKSLLLTGPSGTGKSLLAVSLSGQLEWPLIWMAGSEFFETFVGVGASRVRDLFEQGMKNAPCVLFVDELDAVGRGRTQKSERDETLNQLLVGLDQLAPGVFFIAATNRPDLLDPALLRPGRFDRRVELALPDEQGRLEILKLKTAEMPLEPGVALPALAALAAATPGFSGAALEQVAREAALVAAQRDAASVSQTDFERARERVAKSLAAVSPT